jgi:fengycin family lipopeptide synthetase E
MLNKENIQDVYGLAPMQECMLVQYAKDPETTAYVEQFDFTLQGELHTELLEQSFNLVIKKYSALRTVFSYRKTDHPRQVVLKNRSLQLAVEDFSCMDACALTAMLEDFKLNDRRKGFDLSADLLLRATLINLGNQNHRLVFTFHHIILDGWCLGLVFGDVFSFYDELCKSPAAVIEPRETSAYSQFVAWLGSQDKTAANSYWQEYLAGYKVPAGIPYFDKPYDGGFSTANYSFLLGTELTAAIDSIAKSHSLTFSSIFQTAWGVLLQKFQDTDDVVFGTVVSGRPPALPDIVNMVGLFINTQALRIKSEPDQSFIALTLATQQHIFSASAYEFSPLFEIQAQSELNNRLLNHIVAFENYPLSEQMKEVGAGQGLKVLDVDVFEQTNYDFNVIVNPSANTRVSFSYNGKRYKSDVVEILARSLMHLLNQIVTNPTASIAVLNICAREECERVLKIFNNTRTDYPHTKSIASLFDETATAYSQQVALAYQNTTYRYSELRSKTMEMAHRFQVAGVVPGDVVGLITPRCPEMIIGILAAFYCGASYLPIDVNMPAGRIEFLLDDGSVKIIATLSSFASRLPSGLLFVELDRALSETTDHKRETRQLPGLTISSSEPAYIMYTSGSTGQPKGCVVTHRNITRLVKGNDFAHFDADQSLLLTGAPIFDANTFEIWSVLLNGGRLCLADEADILDPSRLKTQLTKHNVTSLWLTSALFNQLCEADVSLFAGLQQLLVGGDVLSPNHIRRLREAYPAVAIINGYGPTENTTFSTTHLIEQVDAGRLSIGTPIKNSTAYIVDKNLQLLPPGAYGELCVGGDGVALGYLNQPELTAKVFIKNPFAEGNLYRTGDIARWLPDGSIDLLGRKDFQIKIRGFRVELGEIERVFTALDGIQEAIVIVRGEGADKQLHAYFIAANQMDIMQLRALLARQLPGYMIPAYLLQMQKFPLTVNGKVDRAALPIIEHKAISTAVNVQPRNPVEQQVAAVCREVLGLDALSVHDNFFDMGANSLNLITINNRLKIMLNRDIPLTLLFEHTSVAQLAEYLAQGEALQQERLQQEQAELNTARDSLIKNRNLMRMMEVENE